MNRKILVAGDAMIDRYWYGGESRISQEAPVAITPIERTEDRHGGAMNVAANVAAMGGDVAELYSLFHMTKPVIKVRTFSRGVQVARADFDTPQEPLTVKQVIAAAEDRHIVILSDYGKGTLRDINAIIWTLKRAGKIVMVDPKGRSFMDYEGADLLKPNTAEMQRLIGGWTDEEALLFKVKAMQRKARIQTVLMTRGADGLTVFDGKATYIPACRDARAVDVCGAGDVAIAAYAVAIARGEDVLTAARYANRAAGIAITKFGTVTVSKKEVF